MIKSNSYVLCDVVVIDKDRDLFLNSGPGIFCSLGDSKSVILHVFFFLLKLR